MPDRAEPLDVTPPTNRGGRPRKPEGRRLKGEGTIYPVKGRDLLATQVTVGTTPDGKRIRKTAYGKTEKEVLAERERLLRRYRAGHYEAFGKEAERLTTGQYLRDWLELKRPPTVRESSWRRLENFVNVHLVPALGHVALRALRERHVRQLYADKATELAPRTVSHLHAALRAALDQAEADGLLDRNPARRATPPAPPEPVHRPLSVPQVTRLLEACALDRQASLWAVAIFTGCRIGELLGLTWAAVEWDARDGAGILWVRGQADAPVGRAARQRETKSKKGLRPIPLFRQLRAALEAQLAQQQTDRARWPDRWRENGLVFASRTGTPLNYQNVRRAWRLVLARAGLDDQTHIHDTRHSQGTALNLAGVDPATIAAILGHADKAFTMRTYVSETDEGRERAAGLLQSHYALLDEPAGLRASADYIRPAEMAHTLGVSISRISQLVRAGTLPVTRVGQQVLVRREDWATYLAGRGK